VRPLGTVSKLRLTFCGKTSTDVVAVNPDESVTVSMIR
jgi:hypothetical protein